MPGALINMDLHNQKSAAALYATIGRTIAHEMTHAFDRYPRKFVRKDWKNINVSLINQFNDYSIQKSYFVDGKLTLRENFADLGGVEVSLLALQLYLNEKAPNLSQDQLFDSIREYFIAYAEFWREKSTAEFEISTLERVHAPQKYRAIGPIYNQDIFYKVFEIDKSFIFYIPEYKRITIW
jgi:putative endopeptidase